MITGHGHDDRRRRRAATLRVELVRPDEVGHLGLHRPRAVVDVNEIADTDPFQAKKNVRIAAVNTPGAANGPTTFRNACRRGGAVHLRRLLHLPRDLAEEGRQGPDRQGQRERHVRDDQARPGVEQVSVRHRSNSGPTSATTGNIAIARATDRTSRLPRNSSRAMA